MNQAKLPRSLQNAVDSAQEATPQPRNHRRLFSSPGGCRAALPLRMGRVNLPLVAAALVFGQELWRVQMQLRSGAAPRKRYAPVVRHYHTYTLLDSLVAA